KKGFLIVDMDSSGNEVVEKRLLKPKRDLYTVEATMDDLLTHRVNEDYVFISLRDETPVLTPREKVRSVYPNAMQAARKWALAASHTKRRQNTVNRSALSDVDLFKAFYKEVKGEEASEETVAIFEDVLDELLHDEREIHSQEIYAAEGGENT